MGTLKSKDIPERFLEKSDYWGARYCLRLLGVPFIWIVLIPIFHSWSPVLAAAIVVPLGIAISKTTLLVHEAVHDSLFKTSILNQIAGRVGGWWTVVDFASFDALHRKHHSTVGEEDDPQILDYGALQNATKLALAWHLFRPLLGWNIRHMATLVKKRIELRRNLGVTLVELAGLIAVQGSFFLIATRNNAPIWLGLIFPIAASTVGLFMSQIRGFCEHVPLPGEEPLMRLRSHISNPVERPFLHYMNYNYHGEHHRYPWIPSRNLPAFAAWLESNGEHIEHSQSYMSTVWERLKAADRGGNNRAA